jgi:hypothetical protein
VNRIDTAGSRPPLPARSQTSAGVIGDDRNGVDQFFTQPDFAMATETEKRRMSQAMAHACSSVGGQTVLARAIGRPEETVSDWATGKSLVEPELVVEIECITGVSRHELRPDLSRIFGVQR